MNYKKIIKSRDLRIKLLNLLNWIPDKLMVKIQYKIKTGRSVDLKNPQRFTEKLQWYKLYYRDPVMKQCVDKYEVRKYLESKGLGNILNECYGVYESADDIDFEKLPDSFVLKDTLGGGGNSVIVVKDKKQMDVETVKGELKKWIDLGVQKVNVGREWVYCDQKHRIIIEKYIESDPDKGGLIDYKFFCFNGIVRFLYVMANRKLGNGSKIGIYDAEFNRLNVTRPDDEVLDIDIKKPLNYDEMLECAKTLSKDFPHARIDLYNQDNKIIFGEITFFNASGYFKFEPDKFDYEIGKYFKIGEVDK